MMSQTGQLRSLWYLLQRRLLASLANQHKTQAQCRLLDVTVLECMAMKQDGPWVRVGDRIDVRPAQSAWSCTQCKGLCRHQKLGADGSLYLFTGYRSSLQRGAKAERGRGNSQLRSEGAATLHSSRCATLPATPH